MVTQSHPTPTELLACATAAAKAGGDHAAANLHRRHEVFKAFDHDVKLQLDLECQARAEDVIRAAFPSHAVLGEEDPLEVDERRTKSSSPTTESADPTFLWIVDPIDGTINFSHGMPQWCCSIAVAGPNGMEAGAVYAPEFDELYTATCDGPAQCNGRSIHVSDAPGVGAAIIRTGVDARAFGDFPPFTFFERIALKAQRARIVGSAALDLCHVASGQADGYFEPSIHPWDVAAAGLIIRQAGGQTTCLGTREASTHTVLYAASNAAIHDELVALVGEGLPTLPPYPIAL